MNSEKFKENHPAAYAATVPLMGDTSIAHVHRFECYDEILEQFYILAQSPRDIISILAFRGNVSEEWIAKVEHTIDRSPTTGDDHGPLRASDREGVLIRYRSGKETHASNWGEFYVFGFSEIAVREDSESNVSSNHYNYQEYAALTTVGAMFSIHERTGSKRGTDSYTYRICRVLPAFTQETLITNTYTRCWVRGPFEVIASANTKVKAARLMDWWRNRKPDDVDAYEWAKHCAKHINTRGLKVPPEVENA